MCVVSVLVCCDDLMSWLNHTFSTHCPSIALLHEVDLMTSCLLQTDILINIRSNLPDYRLANNQISFRRIIQDVFGFRQISHVSVHLITCTHASAWWYVIRTRFLAGLTFVLDGKYMTQHVNCEIDLRIHNRIVENWRARILTFVRFLKQMINITSLYTYKLCNAGVFFF